MSLAVSNEFIATERVEWSEDEAVTDTPGVSSNYISLSDQAIYRQEEKSGIRKQRLVQVKPVVNDRATVSKPFERG